MYTYVCIIYRSPMSSLVIT